MKCVSDVQTNMREFVCLFVCLYETHGADSRHLRDIYKRREYPLEVVCIIYAYIKHLSDKEKIPFFFRSPFSSSSFSLSHPPEPRAKTRIKIIFLVFSRNILCLRVYVSCEAATTQRDRNCQVALINLTQETFSFLSLFLIKCQHPTNQNKKQSQER